MKRVVYVVAAFLLTGCGDGYVGGLSRRVDVWHDDARGVTCWIVSGGDEASITCLPDSALTPKTAVPK